MNVLHHLSVALLVVLVLAGCSVRSGVLPGTWEGSTGETTVVLEFHRDRTAEMRLAGGGNAIDFNCTWSVAGNQVKLVHEHGQTAAFRILECSQNDLVLRIGPGAAGVCHLRRTS